MPAASARSMNRHKNQAAIKKARQLFKEAILSGEQAERNLKAVINTLPWYRRMGIAVRLIFRRWK